MRSPFVLALVAGLVLAGCTEPPSEAPDADQVDETASPATSTSNRGPASATQAAKPAAPASNEIHLHGNVVTAALAPIANATVSIIAMDLTQRTKDDGGFDFGSQQSRIHTLQVSAAGYLEATLTVTPQDAAAPLKVVLEPGYPTKPYNTTVSFHGILECAFEALIISPSCDSPLTVVPGAPHLFRENQSFLFGAGLGWKTLVVDVVFDGDANPGLDGLRTAVRGSLDPDGGGEYVQYGRWNNPTSFTVRIEPGGNYTDGTEPVPLNATGFQVDVYPHGHAYHQVCAEASCFLGAGVGLNVEFDVYATLFYVEPAPDRFTLLKA